MCMNSSELFPRRVMHCYRRRRQSTRPKVHIHLLHRRRTARRELSKQKRTNGVVKTEMEIKNLKLYMENQSIIEENEKLRQTALLLHQENKALMTELQNKLIPPKITAPN